MHNILKKTALLCIAAFLAPGAVAQETTTTQATAQTEVVDISQRNLSRAERLSRNSAVRVAIPGGGHGSGTYVRIGQQYGVLTALHVVRDLDIVFVQSSEHELVPASVVYRHESLDFAVLKVPKLETRSPVRYRTTRMENLLGRQGVYTGYPSNFDLLTIRGTVSGLDPQTVIMQSFGWFGVSGSGVFDEDGKLIGVVSGITLEHGPFGPELLETMIHVAPISSVDIDTIEEALTAP